MKTKLWATILALSFFFFFSPILLSPSAAETNVSEKIGVFWEGTTFDHNTGITSYSLSLKNNSRETLPGPFRVVVEQIDNSHVSVINPDGYTSDGKPYFIYNKDSLVPWGKTASKVWKFGHQCKRLSIISFKEIRFFKKISQWECSWFATCYTSIFSGVVTNHPPVAEAGSDRDVTVGDLVTLDGRNSYDPDEDLVTYNWSITGAPAGSTPALDNPASVVPTFTPDKPGIYTFSLIVSDGKASSAPDFVQITAALPNVAPTANAGPDQSVITGSIVNLDGSWSFDPDGDPLTYYWQILSKPEGSNTYLSDPNSASPNFLADQDGDYFIQLTVSDGDLYSLPDDVIVVSATPNAPPVSYAGDDQTVSKNSTMQLDGRGSSDPNNDTLTYSWTIVSKPEGSTSELDNPASPTPQILADKAGDYVFTLVVYDGELYSNPDTVVIKVVNDPPIANAGPDQDGVVGVPIALNGSASSDPNGDILTYQWSIVSAPSGSSAVIVNPTSMTSSITPDLPGIYAIQLVVNDGSSDSFPDTVNLTVRVMVPNVVGQSQASAEAAIIAAGLTVGAVTYANSAVVPAGNIISQNPAGGTLALAGSSVSLTVSLGPVMVLVPNVVGMTQSVATAAIQAANLVVGAVTTANSLTIPAGSVISQTPVGGTSAPQGSAVNLVVSLGPAMVTVPNMAGLAQSAAQSAIGAVGLIVGLVTSDYHDTIPPGSVISQIPAGGSSAVQGSSVSLVISLGPAGLPPDPGTVAPPIDPTVATDVATATEFLYTGASPIQTGVAPGTIDSKRVAVLRGKVLDRNNSPLYGVTISILNHPEFGQTLSRLDGMFDMAVNGGGYLTVNYQKTGYLYAQRQINVPWKDYAWLPDVVLIQLDNQVTTVDLTSNDPIQVARGSLVTDADGPRQATLLIPQGTQAQVVFPDGSTQLLTSLSIRVTEYTIGPNGPNTMPAELPPTSGYTYAVELSADEAISAGATSVRFNQPLYYYVEDFIGFPVGSAVPVGFYDRQKGQWIASDNGRVIKIISISGDLADLDTDGDGSADDAATLAALGIADTERRTLAGLYPVGQQLWRVPMLHFSPCDLNWPFSEEDLPPDVPEIETEVEEQDRPCESTGASIIECQNQTLGERIPIAGTPFTLNYRSDRQKGRVSSRTLTVPLLGEVVPGNLRGIILDIRVAGRRFTQVFDPFPNLTTTFTWDGLDAYGRSVQGLCQAAVSIGYYFRPEYLAVPSDFFLSFAQNPPVIWRSSAYRDGADLIVWNYRQKHVGTLDFLPLGFGGWSIDVHHSYDKSGKILSLGDGSRRSNAESKIREGMITTVAGTGVAGYSGDGGPATQAQFNDPRAAVAPDGSLYIADSGNHRIRRIDPDGIVTTVAGTGVAGYSGDGGPATQAQLSNPRVTVGPDGSLNIADSGNHRIRRIGPDGIITTVAGTGVPGYSGDGGLATQAQIRNPQRVAMAPDGSLYISDRGNHRIRRIGPDGIITTVAGTGVPGYSGDGGPAVQAQLNTPIAAVSPDGSLYISDRGNHRIRRVGTDGIIRTVAGTGVVGYSGDGGPARQAQLNDPIATKIGSDRSIYIADRGNNRIRRVGPDGIITTIAGMGDAGYNGDGLLPAQARIDSPIAVAVGADLSIYIADSGNNRIRRVVPIFQEYAFGGFNIVAEDGTEIYVFNTSGRHLRTINALTGSVVYEFAPHGDRPSAITDGDSNVTTIERNASGNPTAIVGPFGQRTILSVNANGYLERITNPANEAYVFTYTDDGLLTSITDPRNNTSNYQYDELGYLIRTKDPAGGFQTLTRTTFTNGYEVARSTALGRTSKCRVENLTTGGQRLLNTFPGGSMTEAIVGTDGSETITYSHGTVTTLQYGPDPRFGMQSPVPVSIEVKAPSGRIWKASAQRTAQLADPLNPLSLLFLSDNVTVNDASYATVYEKTNMQYTITSPAGRITRIQIDEQERPISIQPDLAMLPMDVSYSSQGQITRILFGDQLTTFDFDELGRISRMRDLSGRSASYSYDSANRVRRVTMPGGDQYGFEHDLAGNLTRMNMPSGSVHVFEYNSADEDKIYRPPVSSPYTWEYSLDREPTRTILPSGRIVEYEYEASGDRATRVMYPEAQVTYEYTPGDSTDRLYRMTFTPSDESPSQVETYDFDGMTLTGKTLSGVVEGRFNYGYNNNLLLNRIDFFGGSDNVRIDITLDLDDFITGWGAFALTHAGPSGAVSRIAGGALEVSIVYDNMGRIQSRTHNVNGRSVYNLALGYNTAGRVARKTESVEDETHLFEYFYDPDGQLIEVMQDGITRESYTYDSNGNRTSLQFGSNPAVATTYDAEDKLVEQGGEAYEYDADGFLIRRGSDIFRYSARGELLEAVVAGSAVTYSYDGTGRRVARRDAAGTTRYYYGNPSDPFRPIAVREPNGQLAILHFLDTGILYAFERGGTFYYVSSDHLGSPILVTDAVGATVKRIAYDSFGVVINDSNPEFELPIGFAGGIADRTTKLILFGFRDYDPAVGRWTAKDPIFFEGGSPNLYVYVLNDPVGLTDPLGLRIITRSDVQDKALQALQKNPLIRNFINQIQSDPTITVKLRWHKIPPPWLVNAGGAAVTTKCGTHKYVIHWNMKAIYKAFKALGVKSPNLSSILAHEFTHITEGYNTGVCMGTLVRSGQIMAIMVENVQRALEGLPRRPNK